jgi:hypothetical protein
MTGTATLTGKSQLTLTKAVRYALGVGPGDQIHFVPGLRGDRVVAMTGDVRRLERMFKGQPPRASSKSRSARNGRASSAWSCWPSRRVC